MTGLCLGAARPLRRRVQADSIVKYLILTLLLLSLSLTRGVNRSIRSKDVVKRAVQFYASNID